MEKLEIDEEGEIIFPEDLEHSVTVSKRQGETDDELSNSDEESKKKSAKDESLKKELVSLNNFQKLIIKV